MAHGSPPQKTFQFKWLRGGWLLGATLLVSTAQAEEVNDYTVKLGDSCAGIARRVLGDARRWRDIGTYNPGYCGTIQKVLLPGAVLRLPYPGEPGQAAPASEEGTTQPEPALPGADARVTTVVHQVEAKAPDAPAWVAALQGTDLFRGWRVSTGEGSAAELTFRDQSLLTLRQNALVIIYGQSAQASRRPASRARLERGTLRSRLSELAGDFTIETAAAEATLGPGSGVVAVDEAGASLVARHEGRPAQVRAAGATVEVPAGTGSRVRQGERPSAPRPLPAAPTWAPGLEAFGPGAPLVVGWQPISGAAQYRLEVSRQVDGADPVASASVVGLPQLTLDLPPGRYYAQVAVVDADGFESRPAPPRMFALSPALIELPGGGQPSDTEPHLVPTGTRITPPEGFRCGLSGQSPVAGPLTFDRPAVAQVACVDAAGEALPGTRLRVEGVRARVVEFPRRIKRNLPIQLKLRLESKAPLPKVIRLEGPTELVFDTVSATGVSEFLVTLRPLGSVQDAPIRVLAGDVEVSRFTLSLKLPD